VHDEPLLTVKDVAKRLSVTEETVRRVAYEGLLAYIRIRTERSNMRFRPADVESYITAQTRKANHDLDAQR